MRKTGRLIQTASIRNIDGTNLDEMFAWEHMGYAEYEFGALARSRKAIESNIQMYGIFPTKFTDMYNKELFVLCTQSDLSEADQSILDLASGELKTKAPTGFGDTMKTKTDPRQSNIMIFWDIDYHFIFSPRIEVLRAVQKLLASRMIQVGQTIEPSVRLVEIDNRSYGKYVDSTGRDLGEIVNEAAAKIKKTSAQEAAGLPDKEIYIQDTVYIPKHIQVKYTRIADQGAERLVRKWIGNGAILVNTRDTTYSVSVLSHAIVLIPTM